jgi:hypothetical protein
MLFTSVVFTAIKISEMPLFTVGAVAVFLLANNPAPRCKTKGLYQKINAVVLVVIAFINIVTVVVFR